MKNIFFLSFNKERSHFRFLIQNYDVFQNKENQCDEVSNFCDKVTHIDVIGTNSVEIDGYIKMLFLFEGSMKPFIF